MKRLAQELLIQLADDLGELAVVSSVFSMAAGTLVPVQMTFLLPPPPQGMP
jgi:hypothetical protein